MSSAPQTVALTTVAMLAFAGNSLFCRAALGAGHIDAATFTSVRLASGALVLWLLLRMQRGPALKESGSWLSALALAGYAVAFSFAYLELSTATGALILFGAVQLTMIGVGIARGERLGLLGSAGVLLAMGGLVALLLPGLAAPPLVPSLLMLASGVAWGVYSLRGKNAGPPLAATAGNFVRSLPIAALLALTAIGHSTLEPRGLSFALASGALASGLGYAIWYRALPRMQASTAATVQLTVPIIAALLGVLFLGESVSTRLVVSSAVILGGIALVIRR